MPLDQEGGILPATSCYLKLAGIKGDSVHQDFAGDIPILTWSWGVVGSHRTATHKSAADVSDVSLTATSSSASPELFGRAVKGNVIKTATLKCVKMEKGKAAVYLTIELSDVYVTSFSMHHPEGQLLPIDQFNLQFSKAEMRYSGSKPDGSPGGNTSASWDLAGNKP